MRLMALASVFMFCLCKERDTVCSHRDADNLLKNVPSELDKYDIDMELQHTDDLIFCVALFTFHFLLDKISDVNIIFYKITILTRGKYRKCPRWNNTW